MPDAIKCVVIAGTYPADEDQCRSFEVFRNACKDVEVVTFEQDKHFDAFAAPMSNLGMNHDLSRSVDSHGVNFKVV